MSRNKVEICGVNTANIKVLSNEEMIDLFIKYQNGDLKAKEELINGNLKLVLSILKKYNNRCDNMDDLFQVGCIGLIKAIDNFNLDYDVKFSTYAVPLIIGECKRILRDNSSLRIARSIKDNAYLIMKIKEEINKKEGKEANIDEIKKLTGLDEYEISLALDSVKEPISMFEPIYNDGGDPIYLEDQISKIDNYSKEDYIALKEALKKIKQKERYVLEQRYLIGKTQSELANELSISQAQISRLEKSGIANIKKLIL